MNRLAIPLVLLTLALPACVSAYQKKEVAELRIEPGVTTKAELLQQLGTPRGREEGHPWTRGAFLVASLLVAPPVHEPCVTARARARCVKSWEG